MKKLYFLMLLIAGMANAQIVNIPDANFKAMLLAANDTNSIASTATNATIPTTYNKIDVNNDGEIQQSEAASVTLLDVSNANIADLTGIEEFISIHKLKCNGNQLTNLNINPLNILVWLECQDNNLTSLNISDKTYLQLVFCYNNQLGNLTLSNLPSLANFYCANNHLTSLDVSSLTNLAGFDCSNNELTELIIKNGTEEQITMGGNLNLQFICADEAEIGYVQGLADALNYVGIVINSYCSFSPGGNYNTITGTITFDADNNGCDASDAVEPNIRVNINEGNFTGASFTSNLGNYRFYTQTGSFGITPAIENPTWFNFSPSSATIPFSNTDNNSITQNFCISANGSHSDVEMAIVPITPARPGFDAVYKLVYHNKGNQTETVYLNFNYDIEKMAFVSASAVSSNIGGGLQWQVNGLQPFQSGSILVVLHVHSPTDIPAVTIGDILTFTSFIDVATDEHWEDNAFTYNQTVVGSFDPNDITCLEGNVVSPSEIGKYLHYAINFENTGTADAESIVVKEVIDMTQYDISSLQVLDSSHPVFAKITGNIVEFIFKNISLHSGGHGNILLKIKSKNDLVQGDTVSKQANIYFDYNAPISTNLENTIFQALSTPGFEIDNSISIYPNPVQSSINIKANGTIKSIQLYDVQGRLLQTNLGDGTTTDINLFERTNGIYFLKILTDKGIKVEKIVKE